ncbi:ABC transporter permease [Microbacterium sp. B2969]|uniref:ABC transporter permease n=1 Tax=Microbacterium alkaliflavum TaxID=3248839 RepID=A0ABW7Q495_9MICO
MLIYIVKHLARAVGVFLTVTFATFVVMYGNGAGVARSTLGMNASEEDVQHRVVELGLDRPLFVQYFEWLGGLFTGNLGRSYYTGQSVTSALAVRVPVTMSLIIATLILTIVISVFLGVVAAYYGGWIDRTVQIIAGIGAAIPPFITAVVLVLVFAVNNPIFPATGYVRPTDSIPGWLASITLPVTAILIGSLGASQIRGSVIDMLSRDFVRTLRARGISEKAVVFRHVLRSASGPGIIAFGLLVVAMFGGTIFVEQVFALPGMGQLLNQSAQAGDVPMVMGCVLVMTVVVLVVNLAADISNSALNPKARMR